MGARLEAREFPSSDSKVVGFDSEARVVGFEHHGCNSTEASAASRLDSSGVNSAEQQTSTAAEIVLIEERALIRECFSRSLKVLFQNPIAAFPSVECWQEVEARHNAGIIILSLRGGLGTAEAEGALDKLSHTTPIVLMADTEQPEEIVSALGAGARGCIPTGTCLEVAAQAIRLVMAGGVFVPANSLIAASRPNNRANQGRRIGDELFTPRQFSIIEELCRGKANKVIAHELNMCESTVKVHVRNIMKKLKAKNRTEVAYFIANGVSGQVDATKTGGVPGKRCGK